MTDKVPELLDILNSPDKENSDWMAFSAALKWAAAEILKRASLIRTYSDVDNMPDKVLNVMAHELRTQYYDESLSIETKRKLIKSTLRWYSKAGTPSAVQELIRTIFGSGELVEWFDKDGEPGTFEIKTNVTITPTIVEDLSLMIKRVKNTRSHLESVTVKRSTTKKIYYGTGLAECKRYTINTAPKISYHFDQTRYAMAALSSGRHYKMINTVSSTTNELRGNASPVGVVQTNKHYTIKED